MSDIDDMLADLRRRRDELRLKMHLASRELKDEWDELEDKMEEFSKRAQLEQTGEGIGRALGQLGNELKQGYGRIRDALRDRD